MPNLFTPKLRRRPWTAGPAFARAVVLAAAFVIFTWLAPPTPPVFSGSLDFRPVTVDDVGPGVRHETYVAAGESPQAIHVVRVERDNPFVSLTATLGRGKVEGTESVLNQARRLHRPGQAVVAGVNADFFASAPIPGQPVGIHMEGGELVVSPNGRPVFGIDKAGDPVIRMAELRGEVWRDGSFDDELFARAPINEVNRPLTRLELVLYTPRLGADTPPVNGTLVTLRGITGPLTPGAVHTGVVVATDAVRAANGRRARIPDDGVVLAARGPAQVLLDELVPGEWVHFRVELADPLHDLTNAVAGWPILLADGAKVELNGADPLVAGRHPRTAVGFNDRELLLVTVDGRQPGYADGMNLHELADLMEVLGATDALNLDGGGSTTMLVRPPGLFEPVVVNRPSDGHERTVANSLFVLSSAPTGTLTRLIPVPGGAADLRPGSAAGPAPGSGVAAGPAPGSETTADPPPGSDAVRVLLGSRLPLSVLGQDARHGPVAVDAGEVLWSATGAGDIEFAPATEGVDPDFASANAKAQDPSGRDGDGSRPGAVPHFVARSPGTALIRARSGLASGTLRVEVVDSVASLQIWPDVVNLAAGADAPLEVRGFDSAVRPVWLNPEQVQWSVAGRGSGISSGTSAASGANIDSDRNTAAAVVSPSGRVTGLRAGEALVQGRLGEAAATARIVVDKPPLPLPAFGAPGRWFANAARARASLSSAPPPRPLPTVAAGAASPSVVKLEYDFTVADGATAAAYVQAVEPIPLPDRPTAIGVWVHADNNEHWLRANIFDGEGTRHVIDFTAVGGVTWTGWRWVTAPLPPDIPLPIAFERIYVAEIHRHRQTPGVLYFDQLQALYATPQLACGPETSRAADC